VNAAKAAMENAMSGEMRFRDWLGWTSAIDGRARSAYFRRFGDNAEMPNGMLGGLCRKRGKTHYVLENVNRVLATYEVKPTEDGFKLKYVE
jgi:hypothetical protein